MIDEPAGSVYFIKVEDGKSKTFFPFIWRTESKNGYKAYAIFYLKKNDPIVEPKLELVKIKGQLELGPWLTVINKIYSEEFISDLSL